MIQLPYYIGKNIRSELNRIYINNNMPEPEEISKLSEGAKFENFLESEFDLITSLRVDAEVYQYLPLFKNVKKLYINLADSITDELIKPILDLYPNLVELTIEGQKGLKRVDLSNNKKLRKLVISSNPDLEFISGIDELSELKEFTFYDNNNYYKKDDLLDNVVELSKKYSRLDLDVLLYPRLMEKFTNDGYSKEEINNLLHKFNWSEKVITGSETKLTYTAYEMSKVYEKIGKIIAENIKNSDSDIEKYAIIYQWMCDNVKYSFDNHDSFGRANGTYNALIYGDGVCEGYTKTMQFLLETVGISSFDISCFGGKVEDERKLQGFASINGEKPATDFKSNHSILFVSIDKNWYYSDVTWDADRYQNGRDRNYFLLSEKDMSKDHYGLKHQSYITIGESIAPSQFTMLMSFAKDRLNNSKNLNSMFENESQDNNNDNKIL